MQRIPGFDIARAFAVLGMVIVNFKIVMSADGNGPPWLVSMTSLFDGRASATFVVLAGAGISLLSNRARLAGNTWLIHQHRFVLLKRAAFLFVVGLLYTPIWPADILHFYGVYIAVAAMLLTVKDRWLITISGFIVALFPILLLTFDYNRGWNWETLHYSDFWTVRGMFRHIFFNGFHPVIPWLSFLLFGMVLGRSDFTNPSTRRWWLIFGISVTTFAETASKFLIKALSANASSSEEIEEIVAVFGTAPMPPMPLYILAGIGVACIVISLSVEIGQVASINHWLKPLVSTGQLALTLYVAHVIIGMGTLEAIGRLKQQSLIFSVSCALAFCVLAVMFAHLWTLRFKRGPLETIMRQLVN